MVNLHDFRKCRCSGCYRAISQNVCEYLSYSYTSIAQIIIFCKRTYIRKKTDYGVFMKKYVYFRYFVVFLVIVLPYFMGAVFNGADMVMAERRPEVEMFLPIIVSSQIGSDMKKETIKAQTVIARSNMRRILGEGKILPQILQEKTDGRDYIRNIFSKKDKVYQQAAEETSGQVLTYQGELKLLPWHKVSGGKTRSGKEAFRDEAYTYLKSVDSSADKKSPDYMDVVEIPVSQAGEVKIRERDSAGYVTELSSGKNLLEGESFAVGMGLKSANFSLQKKGDVYVLRVRGSGHGAGFSQFGGNEMAKGGSSAEEILKKYFPAMKLENL